MPLFRPVKIVQRYRNLLNNPSLYAGILKALRNGLLQALDAVADDPSLEAVAVAHKAQPFQEIGHLPLPAHRPRLDFPHPVVDLAPAEAGIIIAGRYALHLHGHVADMPPHIAVIDPEVLEEMPVALVLQALDDAVGQQSAVVVEEGVHGQHVVGVRHADLVEIGIHDMCEHDIGVRVGQVLLIIRLLRVLERGVRDNFRFLLVGRDYVVAAAAVLAQPLAPDIQIVAGENLAHLLEDLHLPLHGQHLGKLFIAEFIGPGKQGQETAQRAFQPLLLVLGFVQDVRDLHQGGPVVLHMVADLDLDGGLGLLVLHIDMDGPIAGSPGRRHVVVHLGVLAELLQNEVLELVQLVIVRDVQDASATGDVPHAGQVHLAVFVILKAAQLANNGVDALDAVSHDALPVQLPGRCQHKTEHPRQRHLERLPVRLQLLQILARHLRSGPNPLPQLINFPFGHIIIPHPGLDPGSPVCLGLVLVRAVGLIPGGLPHPGLFPLIPGLTRDLHPISIGLPLLESEGLVHCIGGPSHRPRCQLQAYRGHPLCAFYRPLHQHLTNALPPERFPDHHILYGCLPARRRVKHTQRRAAHNPLPLHRRKKVRALRLHRPPHHLPRYRHLRVQLPHQRNHLLHLRLRNGIQFSNNHNHQYSSQS